MEGNAGPDEGNLDVGRQKFISQDNDFIDDINANITLCVDSIRPSGRQNRL